MEPFEEGPDPHRQYVVTVVAGPAETLVMFMTGPAEQWDALQPTFDAMLASLQVDAEGMTGQDP